jgi:hypothetical protein
VWERLQRNRWDTWPSSDAVLGRPERTFRRMQPFDNDGRTEAEELPVMFSVAFDPSAAAHVRAHGLAHAPRGDARAIPPFPTSAIALKLVWYPVHAHGLTPMPIWDGDPAAPDARGNADRTWRRAIAVDASRDQIPDGERADLALNGRAFPRSRVVPLAAFLHRPLDTPAALAAAREITSDATLAAGDFVALVAMHVTTKEQPDWIWATYWWHDAPAGPFAAGRPAALGGAAAHYLMATAFTGDQPCMNPWLEARFPNGLASNCIACHQRAVALAHAYLPVPRAPLAPDDPFFATRTTTDFLWTLALEAR